MARRSRRRRRNLTPVHWGLIGVGTLAVGGVGYYTYRAIRARRAKPTDKLPVPPRRPPLDIPVPPPPECPPDYPGFVTDPEGGCVPGPSTPAGIYVAEGCSDFVFVEGDAGPQLDYLEALVEAEAEASQQPAAQSADPTSLATDFLSEFWGECNWPPAPDGPERIVQLYQAVVYVIGREIMAAGGRVVGTNDPDMVDEQIAERLAELGFGEFDPTIVPEIDLPSPYRVVVATPVGPAQAQISEP